MESRKLKLNATGAHFMHQDPQQHIYDDLDNTTTSCSSLQGQGSNEIEPQLVSIESVIGRGKFAPPPPPPDESARESAAGAIWPRGPPSGRPNGGRSVMSL